MLVEIIPIQKINEACERLVRSDVKYRFSVDMATLKELCRPKHEDPAGIRRGLGWSS